MSAPSPKLPSRETPHIRLKSEQHDVFSDKDVRPAPPAPSEHGVARLRVSGCPLTRRVDLPQSTGTLPAVYSALNARRSTELLIPPRLQTHRQRPGNGRIHILHAVMVSRRGANDVNTQTVTEKYNIMPTGSLLLFPENRYGGECDIWDKRGMINMGGLVLLTIGFMVLFIRYPVVTAMKGFEKTEPRCGPGDTLCLDFGDKSLLSNIRRGLIDPDTPESTHSKVAADGKDSPTNLTPPGRTFHDGDDHYYQGEDIWDGVTQDLEVRHHGSKYRSGMLQSGNKLCFSGGRLEASVSLPSDGEVSGFWPGFWAMGNLGRPGYAATTDVMWPYSYYDGCDAGVTPNQSSPDGIYRLPGMRLPACTCPGSDHPSPGRSRSAPEVDVIEASLSPFNGDDGRTVGSMSQSLQMAPFDIWYMPDYAVSGITNLNKDWYNGKAYQTYAFEYTPAFQRNVTFPNGNVGQRVIPLEPLAKHTPAYMRFDYIRIYQDPDAVSVTCEPEGWETTEYIEKHPKAI
ncbi:beta-glucan synthesis-associated protein-domain-containing protein [Aspergillus desertorum]